MLHEHTVAMSLRTCMGLGASFCHSTLFYLVKSWLVESNEWEEIKANYPQGLTGLSQHFCIKEQGHPAGPSIEGRKNLVSVVLKQMRQHIKEKPYKGPGEARGDLMVTAVSSAGKANWRAAIVKGTIRGHIGRKKTREWGRRSEKRGKEKGS